jgi:hypothetical protein
MVNSVSIRDTFSGASISNRKKVSVDEDLPKQSQENRPTGVRRSEVSSSINSRPSASCSPSGSRALTVVLAIISITALTFGIVVLHRQIEPSYQSDRETIAMETIAAIVMLAVVFVFVGIALDAALRAK